MKTTKDVKIYLYYVKIDFKKYIKLIACMLLLHISLKKYSSFVRNCRTLIIKWFRILFLLSKSKSIRFYFNLNYLFS